MNQHPMNIKYCIGIDGGGSKCQARLETIDGRLLAETNTGPANIYKDFSQATSNIELAFEQLLDIASNNDITETNTLIVAGLAGYDAGNANDKLAKWKSCFPNARYTSDLKIACAGAHAGSEGGIIIVGTGSSAMVNIGHKDYRFGGHGLTLGDDASGAALGLQLVKHSLKVIDGLLEPSPMIEAFLNEYASNSRVQVLTHYSHASPAEFAKLAPLIFSYAEQNDLTALQFVEFGSDYLLALFNKIQTHGVIRVALSGGLADRYMPYIKAKLKEQESHLLVAPLMSPEQGATMLAKQYVNSITT